MARVTLVEKEQAEPVVKELFQKIEDNGAKVLNLYKAMANSPYVVRDCARVGNDLFRRTELPPTLRELAVLRVANLSKCEYERAQHVLIAKLVGLSQEQISAIPKWEQSSTFNDTERAVLQYTDEVAQNVTAKDETFDTLKKYLNEREIVELTLSIGYWGMVARILVALEVDMEEEPASTLGDLQGRRKEQK